MQTNSNFSLAAALFGWPAAPGHSAPNEAVPDAWVLLFREQHATLDPALLNGLFCSCRAGRDWVLDGATRAVSLTLDTTTEQPEGEWDRRIATLRQCLSARGALPVSLTVLCDTTAHSAASVPALASLASPSLVITQLTVREGPGFADTLPIAAVTSLLHTLAPTLGTHLTTLSVNPCACALPPPSLLPQVRSLSVTIGHPELTVYVNLRPTVLHSIAPYVAQLGTLEVNEHDIADQYGPLPWPAMAPATPSHTLTSFSTDRDLDNGLLSVIMHCMPAVASVCGGGLDIHGDHSSAQWAVRELTIGYGGFDCMPNACRLPRCKAGAKMTVTLSRLYLDIQTAEGLDAELLSRLPEWRFACDFLLLRAGPEMPWGDNHTALLNALKHLCDAEWVRHDMLLKLVAWCWDPDMMRKYAQTIPALQERGLARHVVHMDEPLTDDMLSACIEAGPRLTSLSVDSLALQSHTHVNTPWPWREFSIQNLDDLSQLLKLPNPAGEGSSRDVKCDCLTVKENVNTADTNRLRDWLQHAPTFFHRTTLKSPARLEQQTATLRRQLAYLSAIAPANVGSRQGAYVSLGDRAMTSEAMETLRDLPTWHGNELELDRCTWPLAPAEYTRLAQVIPPTYTMWCLGDGASEEIVSSICVGINARASGTVALIVGRRTGIVGGSKRVGEHTILKTW